MEILTVDYSSSLAPKQFAQSCHDTGFAVIRAHPISKDLIDSVYADWKNYFSSEAKFEDIMLSEAKHLLKSEAGAFFSARPDASLRSA